MAKNDVVLIDGILKDYNKSDDIGENFEKFSVEQILKDYDLSEDELDTGTVDGRDDGGIDYIYYFINNRIVNDVDDVSCGTIVNFTAYVITCKHDAGFKMVPINNLSTTLDEFFDLTLEESELKSNYNDDVLFKRKLLKLLYEKVAPYLVNFNINLIYASRGNTSELANNVISKADYLCGKVSEKFGKSKVQFNFIGSTELLEIYRKQKQLFSSIKCLDVITCNDSYIAVCNLKDYYDFIIDSEDKLKRYFLDSNVRAYMGDNRVNTDILNTLRNPNSAEFWFLNNGITILSDQVTIIGKKICVQNVQIVNGLQTTETIFNFYSGEGANVDENRNILLKIIVSADKKMRDDIIKSTNNQTSVELYSLKATDKIQRDIEEILLKNDLFYERRTNFYLNQGVEKEKIFTPLYLAYGYISLIMKLPYKSVSLKAKFMNDPRQYELVFSEEHPIQVWPVIAKILRKTDKVIEKNRRLWKKNTSSNYLLKYMRNIISFLAVSKCLGKYNFSISELICLDLDLYTDALILDVCVQVVSINEEYRSMKRKQPVLDICKIFAVNNSINDYDKISNRFNPFSINMKYELTSEFIEIVKNTLPEQPWKSGIHIEVAQKLNEPIGKVEKAIHTLVSRGDFCEQKNGILYDLEGNVVDTN